jgi:hypothetical protein
MSIRDNTTIFLLNLFAKSSDIGSLSAMLGRNVFYDECWAPCDVCETRYPAERLFLSQIDRDTRVVIFQQMSDFLSEDYAKPMSIKGVSESFALGEDIKFYFLCDGCLETGYDLQVYDIITPKYLELNEDLGVQ